MISQYVLMILILLLAIPIGYFLAKLTKEELVKGRKGFLILFVSCLFISLIILFLKIDFNIKLTIIFTLLFMAIVSFISNKLSYNKKFIKK